MKTRSKSIFAAVLLLVGVGCSQTQEVTDTVLLPRPQTITYTEGTLDLNAMPQIEVQAEDAIRTRLTEYILSTDLGKTTSKATYPLTLLLTEQNTPANEEGYHLTISQEGVKIEARTETGLFYGIQTLSQLNLLHAGVVPTQEIEDAPRFKYRGLHLDVSRHFFSKEFVMKQMEMLASLKMNRLHLHLTDGAGWRLEIKKYPLLTDVAAWRVGKTWMEWRDNNQLYCSKNDPQAEGGYYTREDVAEMVAKAEQLHITIIPEIEMPGHSDEVLAVYPELSCKGKPYAQGEFCIGNEETFTFLENVLLEVMEMFPSEYIHIGGDEAGKGNWKECPKCQARIKKEGLKSEEELQSYAIHRMERFLNAHGRQLLGWDEILEGGLAPQATVMSWRGEEGGRKAAAAGHNVVMTPGGYCYFDAYQDSPETEPQAMSGYTTTEKVYSYDPAPQNMEGREYVLGVQANLWTEYIPTPEHAEYMIYPRLFAISEIGWSAEEGRTYEEFEPRAIAWSDVMRKQGYNVYDLKKKVGERPVSLQKEEHLAVGCPVEYASEWSEKYAAGGETALTDGIHGSWAYGDRWQGFLSSDVDVVIDLGEKKALKEVSADFLQWRAAWIWLPEKVEISLSDDGKEFRSVGIFSHNISQEEERPLYLNYAWQGEDAARYIRYHAYTNGIEGGWLFTDEITVK